MPNERAYPYRPVGSAGGCGIVPLRPIALHLIPFPDNDRGDAPVRAGRSACVARDPPLRIYAHGQGTRSCRVRRRYLDFLYRGQVQFPASKVQGIPVTRYPPVLQPPANDLPRAKSGKKKHLLLFATDA